MGELFVLEDVGRAETAPPLAVVELELHQAPGRARLVAVGVAPGLRRCGLGRRLMEGVEMLLHAVGYQAIEASGDPECALRRFLVAVGFEPGDIGTSRLLYWL